IAITAGMQDRGFGTEAVRAMIEYGFGQMKLKRIFLKVYPHNLRAIHVYRKCGFIEYDRTDEDIFMEITR
ncbi:MAG: GNAT family N-acetyltransferase, partial [Lachnospiraceae bacterium]|nr:GNAT family N-acetyltransferase [Lachnospiraceae bacterium]